MKKQIFLAIGILTTIMSGILLFGDRQVLATDGPKMEHSVLEQEAIDKLEKAETKSKDKCKKVNFFGIRAWYEGLLDSNCNVRKPSGNEEEIAVFVWTIILNIFAAVTGLVGYIATGFVIYGGFLFLRSDGDPGKAAKAKKTITSAVIGLVIAVLATVISGSIVDIIQGAAG